ncbi:hypothetical protein F383_19540 [Gossypium arboreum]|uniref:Uncharacterized protein n=1 Tax=Gossypium arboreum TaxID=29729 RepID=A0A0B0NGX8_GOSAR|nr:hypothetical protein F383_19540 [Gossypium arboreum]
MFAMTLSMEFDIEIVKFNFEAKNHRIRVLNICNVDIINSIPHSRNF